jgi:hypothetical protein
MAFFKTTFRVKQNEVGYLFEKYKLIEKLETGIHKIPGWGKEFQLICLPTNSKLMTCPPKTDPIVKLGSRRKNNGKKEIHSRADHQ